MKNSQLAEEPEISNPIFAMAARAEALRQQGVDVIALAAGEPDSGTAEHVVQAAAEALRDRRNHHYGSAAGDPHLRTAVAASLERQHRVPITASSVQITAGAKHAIHLALRAITSPGDDVLVVHPGWPGHHEVVHSVDASPVAVPTGNRHHVEITALEAARTTRTRALILANPSNPTGAVHDSQELTAIANWCVDNDIWLISDEVYDALIYTNRYTPVLAAAPPSQRRTVIVGGVSKVHAMTGWRIGWLTGPDEVVTEAREQVGRTITHVPLITQMAALTAVRDTNTPKAARDRYTQGRDLLVAGLRNLPGFTCDTPDGGMFAFPSVEPLLDHGPWRTTTELASWLLDTAHVAVVAGEAFNAPGRLRLNFSVQHSLIEAAVKRISLALSTVEGLRS